MKLFRVESRSKCGYILGGNYCDHPEGPILCQGDDFPENCPGEDEGAGGLANLAANQEDLPAEFSKAVDDHWDALTTEDKIGTEGHLPPPLERKENEKRAGEG